KRLSTILELWEGILGANSFPHELHKEFKSYLDQLPVKTLKRVKAAELPEEISCLPPHFKTSYIEVLTNHSWFSDADRCCTLMSNHLHMFVNRAFLLSA